MFNHNPGSASKPDPVIDLTSLLDVVFIFLFVIMLAFSQQASKKNADDEQKIEQLKKELTIYQAAEYDYETIKQSYDASIQQYQELEKIVKKITVYCNYDHNNASERTIRVFLPDGVEKTIQLTRNNTETGFNQFRTYVEEYIDNTIIDDRLSEDSSTGNGSFIVIILSLDDIQRGDRERIDKIATEFMEKYENVYYRKYKAE